MPCAVAVFAATMIGWAAQNPGPIAFAKPVLAVKAPPDNPTTPEKVALGRLLFWDPILSGNKDVACATCHHPNSGYSDGLPLSKGVKFAKRNSQTILNTALNGAGEDGAYDPSAAPMFWDVRVRSLETQALEPLKALEEMRGTTYEADHALDAIVARLRGTASIRPQDRGRISARVPESATAAAHIAHAPDTFAPCRALRVDVRSAQSRHRHRRA